MQPSRIFFLAFYTLLISCNSSNDPLEVDRWELISVFSYMTNTELTDAELEFTETVDFVEDGLFLKLRTIDR